MSTHWYNTDGLPVHEITGANGKSRPRTLRDARKTGDANSVTGFIDILDKPQLTIWSNNQILEAVIRNKPPVLVGTSDEITSSWKSLILEESKKIGKDAAIQGSKIHNALEQYIKTGKVSEKDKVRRVESLFGISGLEGVPDIIHPSIEDFILPVISLLKETFEKTDWVAERSFYNELGFGGTVDLHSYDKKIVIDFKTKKDKAFTKGKMGYDNHMMQLAAYGAGLGFLEPGMPDTLTGEYYNLFISSETPGIVILEQWDINDIQRGYRMFKHLVEFWKLSKQYDPNTVNISEVSL